VLGHVGSDQVMRGLEEAEMAMDVADSIDVHRFALT
jgi:hypothetical protein